MIDFKRFTQQVRALLWKGFIIRVRHPIVTALEFIVPLFLSGILVWGTIKSPPVINENYPKSYRAGEVVPVTMSKVVDFNMSILSVIHRMKAGKIYYIPNTTQAKDLMTEMKDCLDEISDNEYTIMFEARESADDLNFLYYSMPPILRPRFPGFIEFRNTSGLDSINGTLEVTIHQEGLRFVSLTRKWRDKIISGPIGAVEDYNKGFLQLQMILYEAYLSLRSKRFKSSESMGCVWFDRARMNLTTRRIPYPEHRVIAQDVVIHMTPLAVTFGIIVSFSFLVYRTCQEKSSGSREMLTMAGLNQFAYWYSNFMNTYLSMSLISLLQLIIIFLPFNGSSVLFANSSYFLIICICQLYITHTILFGQLVTILFNKPVVGVCVALMCFIFTFAIPDTFLNGVIHKSVNGHDRRMSCIFPNSAVVWIFRIISEREIQGFGINFHSLNDSVDVYDDLTVLQVLLIQLLTCVLFIIAIWYLDLVWPWQMGIPKPFYFPFTRAYWCLAPPEVHQEDDHPRYQTKRSRLFESETPGIKKAIEVKRLTKVFSCGWSQPSHVAVNKATMNVFPGSITCLLGHNGAGKTTTMSMITGMITPTEGSIRVDGFDLFTDTSRARSKMSLCPQHNSLYDELTVSEHLFLYAAVKGHPWNDLNTSVLETINSISLSQHKTKRPGQLSGGMKRKLCLGIALVGDSKIVILDEPSAGLDTEARRGMWDALKEVRRSRTILMTTHDMEEADALADRIIIMHSGKVVCSGSSMFLKKALCTGYVLRILKSLRFKHAETLNFIQKLMPKATIKSEIGSEISYELNESQETSVELGTFFSELEGRKEKLGIDSFGVTVSTLDEVFLKMGELADSGADEVSTSTSSFNQSVPRNVPSERKPRSRRLTGAKLIWAQFRALMIKRFQNAKRYWPMVIFQLAIPSAFFLMAFLITNPAVQFPLLSASLFLKRNMYPSSTVFLQFDKTDSNLAKYAEAFEKQVKASGSSYLQFDPTFNVTDYLLNETYNHPFDTFMSKYIQGVTIESTKGADVINFLAWINIEAYHSLPLVVDLIYQAHEMTLLDRDISILPITNSLLPSHDVERIRSIRSTNVVWTLFVSLSITFIAASYVIFPISEVSTKAKLIQIMAGVNSFIFHASSFVFDLIQHNLCTVTLMLMFYLFDSQATFTSFNRNFDAMILLMMLFGASVILIAYTFSMISRAPAQGFLILQVVYCIIGIILVIIASTFEFFALKGIVSRKTFNFVVWLFRFSPIFSLSWAFKKLHFNGVLNNLCESIEPKLRKIICKGNDEIYPSCCESTCYSIQNKTDGCIYPNPYGWSGNRIGKELTMIFVQFTILILILIFVENRQLIFAFFAKRHQIYVREQDEDVLEERVRVENLVSSRDTRTQALVVNNVKKRFAKVWAVKGIHFAIRQNECFGLLGVNGAGKSTTFAMLTGDILPDSGKIYQGDLNVFRDLRAYRRKLGYCPQVNPILDLLTGREMLILLARIHGIPEMDIPYIVNEMIGLVDLDKHADKASGCYSGGNKRKLCIALAMIGNPKLVLLDEPTAGVDPAARRVIWSTLSTIREKYNCAMILTSHSMEECETLCSRMAIMVSGEFVCIGSGQHLKNRFGDGFTLSVKLTRERPNMDTLNILNFKLSELLGHVQLVDQHGSFVTYRIAKDAGSWSYLFNTMEQIKSQFGLEDYLLSDTTLEQIFIHFARRQTTSTSTSNPLDIC